MIGKLLINVLCMRERDGWVNPGLAMFLTCIADAGLPREQRAVRIGVGDQPHDLARNKAVKAALDWGAEWLLMIDNDIDPPLEILQVPLLAGGEHDIIALLCWINGNGGLIDILPPIADGLRHPKNPLEGFQEVRRAGTGVMFIRRRVLEAIPAPHFVTRFSSDGLQRELGEDFSFCELARKHGFRVWTNYYFVCEHLRTVRIGDVARCYDTEKANLANIFRQNAMRANSLEVSEPDAIRPIVP